MKNLMKLTVFVVAFILASTQSFAIQTGKIKSLINSSELNKTSTIAVSIKNVDGARVLEQNELKLLHPASTIKIFSLYPSLDELGYDYTFKTEFYTDSNNNLYVKTSADPTLTSAQLKNAFAKIKDSGYTEFANLYFDDGVLDKNEFSEGWMWDDDINEYTPKVSSYNLDSNSLTLEMTKNGGDNVQIKAKNGYPAAVISNVRTGAKADRLDIKRYNWINPDVIEITGAVKQPKSIKVPVSNMRKYFIYNTEKALNDTKIKIKGTSFASQRVPDNAVLLTSVESPITSIIPGVLQRSNNVYAETIYKVAGGKKYNATGSDYLAGQMFKSFYNQRGLKTDSIIVKDGCGISRNNLVSADWMTDALNVIYKDKSFEQFEDNMAQPGDGTLSSRLHDLRGNAWLKTGSLSNISGITGYVKSLDGHTYSVAILIQNFKTAPSNVKAFENEIINLIYAK